MLCIMYFTIVFININTFIIKDYIVILVKKASFINIYFKIIRKLYDFIHQNIHYIVYDLIIYIHTLYI